MSPSVLAVVLAALAGACMQPASGAGRLLRLTGHGSAGGRWLPLSRARPGSSATSLGQHPLAGPAGGVAAALAVAAVSGSILAGLVAGAGVLLGHRWHRARAGRLSAARRRSGLVELCQALAAELGSGAPARDALVAASRGLPDLEHLGQVARSPHGDVAQILRSTAACPGGSGLLRLAACWQVSERSGSSLAGSVARLAESLRDEEQVRREVAAQLAGPRATAVLLALLPAFGLLMGTGLGARPVEVLVGSPTGRACLLVGAALEAAGLLWTGHIARRAEPP